MGEKLLDDYLERLKSECYILNDLLLQQHLVPN